MSEPYTVTTYSDGSEEISRPLPSLSSGVDVDSLAGGVVAAGFIAVVGMGWLSSVLDDKALVKHYERVNAAAFAYEKVRTAANEQQLIDSLRYLAGSKIQIFGFGSLSLMVKQLILSVLSLIQPYGLIFIAYQMYKHHKHAKKRKFDALGIAEYYGLSNKFDKYAYSIANRVIIGYLIYQGFFIAMAILSVLLRLA